MTESNEAAEMIEAFRKQYPEYDDIDLNVEIIEGDKVRKFVVSPVNNRAFSVTYYGQKIIDEAEEVAE